MNSYSLITGNRRLRMPGHAKPARCSVLGRLRYALLASLALTMPALADHRVALVIGNAAYQHATALRNPVHDADKVSATLRTLDFDVTLVTDADKIGMEQALRRFAVEVEGADVALFYYSGHAVQVADRNYLVPVSAAIEGPRNLSLDTLALQDISTVMRQAGAKVQLLFLDACRGNPFGTSLSAAEGVSATRGLAPMQTPGGSLVVFSTSPGQDALDGTGELSPFTAAFTRYAAMPKLEIRQVLSRVRADVSAATDERQVPWDNSSLLGDVFLVPNRAPPVFDHQARVMVTSAPGPQALHLSAPRQPEGGALAITMTQLPANGRLMLGPAKVAAGDTLQPSEFERLVYEADAPGDVDTFGFKVEDAWGNEESGLVLVSRAGSAVPTSVPVATRTDRPLGNLQASAVSLLGLGPNLIFRDRLDIPAEARQHRVRLASNLPFGQIVLGDRVIEPGRTVDASDVSKLAFLPPAGYAGRHIEAMFRADDDATGEIRVGIDVSLTDCDRLAGDRLDPQGVAEGVLTGQIDTAAALPACEKAVQSRPSVGRFAYELGRVDMALGRDKEGADLFRKAADLGHTRAVTALAYRAQYVQPVDLQAGKAGLERAAAAGDAFAIHLLGKTYYDGRGVPRDLVKAKSLFETAARMGHTYAMNALGEMYQQGETVPVDLAMARRYWSESAQRGDIYGIDDMGFVYLDGVDVAKDPARALDYFKRAADLGHPGAPNDIGRLYVLGLGVPVDYAEARKWDAMGADRGDAWASYNLGELNRLGRGGPVDRLEAGYFYARAAASPNRIEASDLGRKALGALDRATKMAVLGRLAADIDASGVRSPEPARLDNARRLIARKNIPLADPSLDALLIGLAEVVWIDRIKRSDLF